MRVAIRSIEMNCTSCGGRIHQGFSVIRCLNETCVNYKIAYRYPILKLEPVIKEENKHK